MTRIEQLEQRLKRLEQKICCNKTQFYDTLPEFPPVGVENTLYVDNSTGAIYIWDTDTQTYITTDTAPVEIPESKIDLNTELPLLTPLDTNNPTTAEVQAWATANLTGTDLTNGTQLIYNAPNGGDASNPDYTWTVNNGVVTLSNKRVFNTKTVYVDAGSGSDVTGKRGYREFPFKTLNAGITVIQEDDTLHIFPGEYTIDINTPTKTFGYHINSDLGSNINITTTTSKYLINSTNLIKDYNINFDRLYNTVFSSTAGINFALKFNLSINTISNLTIRAQSAILNNCYIKNLTDSYVVTLNQTIVEPINKNFTFENVKITTDHQINSSQVNTTVSSNFNNWSNKMNSVNLLIKETLTTAGNNTQLLGYDVGSDTGTDKIYSLNINNLQYFNANIYDITPGLYDNIEVWNSKQYLTIPTIVNSATAIWVRASIRNNTDLNININNVIATGNLITIGYGTTSNSANTTNNFNVKGVFKKGIAFISKTEGGTPNLTVNLNLDVISEDCHAVDLSTFPSTGVITISGRIKVTKAGFPCISIRSGIPTQRIMLKDLTLINDGTVGTVITNSLSPIDVLVQNVVTNSLITDVNIVEVGEAITRNSNYK